MTDIHRRALLVYGLLGTQAVLAGCSGGDGEVATPADKTATKEVTLTEVPLASPMPDWHVGIPLAFASGAAASVDLSSTLPAGVARGGKFSIDPAGKALPAGISLSSSGVLTAASTAAVNVISGVVFEYTTP